MNAARLREAAMCFDQLCDAFDEWVLELDNEESRDYLLGVLMQEEPSHLHALLDAARNIALPILEADRREVWFCVAHASSEASYHIWPTSHGPFTDCVMERSLVIPLAAIATPNPVEES